MLNQLEKNHLIRRTTFSYKNDLGESMDVEVLVDKLFSSHSGIKRLKSQLKELRPEKNMMKDAQFNREFKKKQREALVQLNVDWLENMSNSDLVFREKMTLFWHGHFATVENNPVMAASLNNTLRKYAFSDFRTLLLEVSKTNSMLAFLNNIQNKKAAPNENFARELLELFSIGIGNYTENDIKEAARAFTGWSADKQGEFVLRRKLHDFGEKEFMGQKGHFNGDDIIDIILQQKKTADFISEKLYIYFVNDEVDSKKVKQISNKLYSSKYDIEATLRFIFGSKWFYNKQNIASKIKSPIEFISELNTTFEIDYFNKDVQLQFQKQLGQVLFRPPNVAGWGHGKYWINSFTILNRIQLPALLFNSDIYPMTTKKNNKYRKRFKNSNNYNEIASNINAYTLVSQKIDDNKFHEKKEIELLMKISSSEYQLY